ncbi:Anti-sigma-K factor RskA [Palleronia marisminoris]|uniref:Anti-sigma-K factor rskA n=1 Tax=Palleronia marisminoris TaxID=315423 RepID=A0A1Y5RMM9_9RHOB|nr:anti-sigma factor [Palleronia marisminoris]SFG27827.1 Anti-sigma-K factor RskA [Palleronia marisminoris]SLN20859.1 Anti-sigma-K factor rskA [Palleronia marisminoris]
MTDRSLDLLIDEVVLGLASDDEVERVERLASGDPDIAARLERARQKFAPLDDTAEVLPVPDDLWERIEQRLGAPEDAPVAAPSNVIDMTAMRGAVARWRATALGGIAATLALAVVLGWTLMSAQQPAVVAVLLDDQGEAIALVESRADNTTQVTLLERPDVPSDQVMQVWTKPDDDGLPVSLGLLSAGESRTFTIEGLPAPNPQQLYEITFEPAGGSPTNLPTGPILGKGLAKEPVT